MKTTELTIEHLAAYLPYQPLLGWHNQGHKCLIDLQMVANHGVRLLNYKPVLRPLSDLTREITHNGETFVPMDVLHRDFPQAALYYGQQTESDNIPWCLMKRLLTWHFDIFTLIESNLAIDINTLTK